MNAFCGRGPVPRYAMVAAEGGETLALASPSVARGLGPDSGQFQLAMALQPIQFGAIEQVFPYRPACRSDQRGVDSVLAARLGAPRSRIDVLAAIVRVSHRAGE